MPPSTLPVGGRLKALRESRGLTQQDLASRAGLSVSVVFHIEQGQRKDLKLSTLQALADALGVEVGQLVTELTRPEAEEKPAAKKRKGK